MKCKNPECPNPSCLESLPEEALKNFKFCPACTTSLIDPSPASSQETRDVSEKEIQTIKGVQTVQSEPRTSDQSK